MINLGFWKNLKRPIFCLAPMADVTDCVFRKIIAKYSGNACPTEQLVGRARPTERPFGRVFWTEFVSADGLTHPKARKKLLIDLKFSKEEHPIVAQIFGSKPDNIKTASALCRKLGFDGIDINMGCPDRSVEKQCAGAAMMKNPKLAKKIIKAAKKGARLRQGSGGQGVHLPVSVKTRLGYNRIDLDWIRELLSEDLAALTVHLRTRKEMSNVPAHWDLMKRIVEIRDEIKKETLIIGNGDVVDIDDARRKCEDFGCDGVMLGRAIFGNPWLFAECQRPPLTMLSKAAFDNKILKQKLKVMLEHTKLFEKMLGKYKNFAIMKKHFKAYVNGFDGAKELRMKLMDTTNATQVKNIVDDFLDKI